MDFFVFWAPSRLMHDLEARQSEQTSQSFVFFFFSLRGVIKHFGGVCCSFCIPINLKATDWMDRIFQLHAFELCYGRICWMDEVEKRVFHIPVRRLLLLPSHFFFFPENRKMKLKKKSRYKKRNTQHPTTLTGTTTGMRELYPRATPKKTNKIKDLHCDGHQI